MEANSLLRTKKTDVLSQLPQSHASFFKWFLALTEVSRPSCHTEQAQAKCVEWGKALGADVKQDAAGNILMSIPASKGKENVPSILLQGHVDMVAVGSFDNGTVDIEIKDGKLQSVGNKSSIGADDGIAVATMYCILENKDKFEHGPIECLITIDEEIGLVGAGKLEGPPFIKSRVMLNLDSEEWGVYYTSCAGSVNLYYEVEAKPEPYEGRTVEVEVNSFVSGHTGLTIQLGRANAVKWLVRLLLDAKEKGCEFRIASIEGGEKHNSIPPFAKATVVVKSGDFEGILNTLHKKYYEEIKAIEVKNPQISIKEVAAVQPWCQADSDKVINLLANIYHGVWFMHPELEELVLTSQSLSIVNTKGNKVEALVYARSNENNHVDWLIQQGKSLANLAGVKLTVPPEDIYGPWPAALSSKIMDISKHAFKKLYGSEPIIKGIHAGLECGVIQNRGYSDLEAISYGPTIGNPHTIEEFTEIETCIKCYDLTVEIIKEWASQ